MITNRNRSCAVSERCASSAGRPPTSTYARSVRPRIAQDRPRLDAFGKYASYSAHYRQARWSLTRPVYCIPYPCGSMRRPWAVSSEYLRAPSPAGWRALLLSSSRRWGRFRTVLLWIMIYVRLPPTENNHKPLPLCPLLIAIAGFAWQARLLKRRGPLLRCRTCSSRTKDVRFGCPGLASRQAAKSTLLIVPSSNEPDTPANRSFS